MTSASKPPGPSGSASIAAAPIAAHRFGLAEPSLAVVGADPRGWLLAQIGPADAQVGDALPDAVQGVRRFAEFRRLRREAAERPSRDPPAGAGSGMTARTSTAGPAPTSDPGRASTEQRFAEHFRELVRADLRARAVTAATTRRPFAERLALFWCNHFTVSMAKASVRGLAGAFEREAIRPHIAGPFETLLGAAVRHAGMLRYLDNDQSAGPQSEGVQRLQRRAQRDGTMAPRLTGLNENLAREVLELHTLGVAGGGAAYGGWGGYTQRDVTEFARVLTGWRVPLREVLSPAWPAGQAPTRFEPRWHEPGPKQLLGKTYAEGPQALDAVLHDLAHHPSTARHLAAKLARHFVADDPPPALVHRLAQAYARSGGELAAVYRELVAAPEAWQPQPAKLKSPEEFVIGTVRLLALGERAFERQPDGGIAMLGQRVLAAPSPAGWPDRADEWLGPDAVWKRVEWATRVADRVGRRVDARELARAALGPALSDTTLQQIERASDGPQALALLLLSPEFQRR